MYFCTCRCCFTCEYFIILQYRIINIEISWFFLRDPHHYHHPSFNIVCCSCAVCNNVQSLKNKLKKNIKYLVCCCVFLDLQKTRNVWCVCVLCTVHGEKPSFYKLLNKIVSSNSNPFLKKEFHVTVHLSIYEFHWKFQKGSKATSLFFPFSELISLNLGFNLNKFGIN